MQRRLVAFVNNLHIAWREVNRDKFFVYVKNTKEILQDGTFLPTNEKQYLIINRLNYFQCRNNFLNEFR